MKEDHLSGPGFGLSGMNADHMARHSDISFNTEHALM